MVGGRGVFGHVLGLACGVLGASGLGLDRIISLGGVVSAVGPGYALGVVFGHGLVLGCFVLQMSG